ncbi:lipoprotein signal peptidase [Neisseria weixii]|uniref:Lipoprotein signal peptidase n=1 Tax=Neisseria weixii TaxID=1853276 RepID=A0A3N4MX25_9NEIS|nr:lipoprotein signal peptidase [Neisseria weixii]ATD65167.1 lipoprotein signal peptidase [Neisseria weixii]RPD86056.1 lipoprotein signal peptidase [Neisseria weixii]RPD86824.1 lipoprotein signal peptidase [Neisseria weixii]
MSAAKFNECDTCYKKFGLSPLQNLHPWHISSLCAARNLVYLHDMSALSALL